MKLTWKTLACLGPLWLTGPALANPAAPGDPAAPGATVPPVIYRSVFRAPPRGLDSPLQDWKAANSEVGRFLRGHLDLLKWEQESGPASAPTRPSPPSRHPGSHP